MQNKIVKKLLKEQKVDALLITSDYNRLWYTTFSSTAGYLLVTKEKSFLILDGRYYWRWKSASKKYWWHYFNGKYLWTIKWIN
ncbi:aminopeptidase P family N-terminal domain-containing protein [Spiroplasma endosymbiont of Asaphidion curtum]|uniref:aminopeptidase P family N-terminal domain-containing protein n=1 Tax=Spiroplasma endosymbiont of Asaphidion curtum TaxID=3066281 RepID=UPI00313C5804